jgi:hypothetical protein
VSSGIKSSGAQQARAAAAAAAAPANSSTERADTGCAAFGGGGGGAGVPAAAAVPPDGVGAGADVGEDRLKVLLKAAIWPAVGAVRSSGFNCMQLGGAALASMQQQLCETACNGRHAA